ncbi:UDP-N-acetylmuramoyl-tripeptide--D-alanyl-D-alanine ligase [Rhodobacteraceae bacterium THAF1]|uniref:UDP-N-acetylmuramoyl-tripeptide--D-alanyl-D- alanine ligase n=1 Tax=Palleronia sp. THAF1 TaxID=2587842 RepID=UPI000F3ADE5E|nr:UDP-N-acetylmuramoyl-tripeptide--D-alanyl-D-alanine ligase [Palleronia sp. THAF1]QFU09287.1 UDP-N-acetylmuramoyl-tripeptide--D-alanyl-D-alanine ligase [Palleronia sp. THAF1]VDC26629.1 UDP-N-acetylmuramoyl-tripeptide--D-alanyl-D-alanine ligase [Rhodobacteraceae bacterium THAF1]
MSLWTSADAVEATWGLTTQPWVATGVSIDTRTLQPGDLFIALSAARDGHDFVAQALENGAAAALVSRIPEGCDHTAPLLVVDDVQAGLEALGRYARNRLVGRVLAITGSVGKTTTKEMARTAFSGQLRVHAAEASYNNHWGVPLTLARMPPDTELAIIEIGMSNPGEIAPLSRLARPHAAIVTTVAPAHLEAFEDIEGIAREKASIFEGLEPDGTAIVNADLPTSDILRDAGGQNVITFGETVADFHISRVQLVNETTIVSANHQKHDITFKIGAAGRHLAMNAASVICAAEPLGADPDRAAQALAAWAPPSGRGTRERIEVDPALDHWIDLIDDAFNANPASVGAALDRLAAVEPQTNGRRVAVLGDMLELGPDGPSLHKGLARHPSVQAIDTIITAGPAMQALHDALPAGKRGDHFATAEEAADKIGQILRAGDIVLVKGSKSARTSRVVDAIRELGHRDRHRRTGTKES